MAYNNYYRRITIEAYHTMCCLMCMFYQWTNASYVFVKIEILCLNTEKKDYYFVFDTVDSLIDNNLRKYWRKYKVFNLTRLNSISIHYCNTHTPYDQSKILFFNEAPSNPPNNVNDGSFLLFYGHGWVTCSTFNDKLMVVCFCFPKNIYMSPLFV